VETDERHTLTITTDGVEVSGPTPEAVYRGLTSLRQLISATGAVLPVVTVIDGPRFAWRGLSLDVVRTFHAPDEVRRIIDMLALYKLNVLHLHLTDDQGWRVEVPSRPELTDIAAKGALGDRPGWYYTRSELAELVAYAADRFVTVVPEIDMPGHTTSVFTAYPQLAPEQTRTVDLGNGASLQLSTLQPGARRGSGSGLSAGRGRAISGLPRSPGPRTADGDLEQGVPCPRSPLPVRGDQQVAVGAAQSARSL
jgi:hexosaminidase